MKIPITGQTYQTRSRNVNYQEAINCYLEEDPTSGTVMYGTPGLTLFATVGGGPIRGMRVHNGSLYVVSGGKLYEIAPGGGSVILGSLSTETGPVSMTNNINELVIADGVKGYAYNTSTLTYTSDIAVSDADYPNGSFVEFVDGYIIVDDPDNDGRFYVSNSYNALVWDTNDFATAERDPDKLKAIIVNHRNIYLIGEKTTEVWYNSGNASFPFEPIPGSFLETGIVAPYSAAKVDEVTVWLSANEKGHGEVIAVSGNQKKRISNFAIEQEINSYSVISDAEAFAYQQAGHTFYVITFPTADRTWVYDFTTNAWHRRKSYGIGRSRVSCSAYFNGKVMVGDYDSGKIYYYDLDTYTENGETIERVRTTQKMEAESDNPLVWRSLKLNMETGVGDATTTDPLVMLSWSDDGGHTWSNEHFRSLGAQGEYYKDVIYRNLGRSNSRIYRIKVTDPVKFVLLGGYAEADPAIRSYA